VEDQEDEELVFYAISLTIGEEILPTYTFRGSLKSKYQKLTVEMTMKDTGEVLVMEMEDMSSLYNGGLYLAKFNNLPAKQMWREFSVRLVGYDENGNRHVGPADEHSVRSFLLEILNEKTPDYNPKGKRLAADMLNYGAAAQVVFNENVEHLVNLDEEGNEIDLIKQFDTDELPSVSAEISESGEGVKLTTSAALMNRVELTVNGTFNSSGPYYLWVKNTETDVESGPIDMVLYGANEATSRYGFRGYFGQVGAKNMRTMMEITVRDADGNVQSETVLWSIEAMVNEACSSSDTSAEMKTLLYAMLTYGDSAALYLGN
jgi:hypothetical protein